MKKVIALLLALLMLCGMAACSKSKDSAKTAEPAAAAAAKDTPAPTAAPTATPAPTDTPAPTEVPAEVAVVNALEKLDELKSLRMDMTMLMEMSITIAAQGMTMNMPIKVNMDYGMDVQKSPYMTKMDVKMDMDMGAMGKQNNTALVYMDMTGDKPVGYSSTDGGVTWVVESEEVSELKPQESILFLKDNAKVFEKVGADTVDGKAVTVYTGKLDGKYAQEIMGATGMEEMMSDLTGAEGTAAETAELKDLLVTVYVDDETGYPVYYAMDMTDMMKDILAAAMKKALGMEDLEGMEVTLDVPAVKVESTLSQFDSVPAIEIPEAALAANNN